MLAIEEQFIYNSCISYLKHSEINHIPAELDFDKVLSISLNQKIFFVIYNVIKNILPHEYKNKYKAIYFHLTNKIKRDIKESYNLYQKLKNNNIDSIIVKGFILSNIIYDDKFMRQYDDIDFLVKYSVSDDVCRAFIKWGYSERRINEYKTVFDLNEEEISAIYYDDKDKVFSKEGSPYIEVKNSTFCFCKERVLNSFDNLNNINITDDMVFQTLNNSDTVFYALTTLFENFYHNWSIELNYKIRDIIDLYLILTKYKNILTEEFLTTLDYEEKKIAKMSIDVLKSFLKTELLDNIPDLFLNIDIKNKDIDMKSSIYGKELKETEWDIDILTRIFNSEKRISAYRSIMYKKKVTESPELPIKFPVGLEKFKNTFFTWIYYSNNKIYLNFKFHDNCPNLYLDIHFYNKCGDIIYSELWVDYIDDNINIVKNKDLNYELLYSQETNFHHYKFVLPISNNNILFKNNDINSVYYYMYGYLGKREKKPKHLCFNLGIENNLEKYMFVI